MGLRLSILIWSLLAGIVVQPAVAQVQTISQASGTDALLIGVSPVTENIVWVSGTRGTWLRTLDGGSTWPSGRVPGADSLQFRDVHGVDAQTAYLLSIGNGAQSRIYKTRDGGSTWALQFTNPDSLGFYDCFDFWDAERGIAIGDAIEGQIAMLVTTNGGATWTRVPADRLPPAEAGEGSFAASGTCVATRPGGHAWIVMSTPRKARVLHTADYGQSWSFAVPPITTHEGSGPQSVSFRDERHGVVLGGGGAVTPGDTLAATTSDGGKTWAARTSPPLVRGVWGATYVPDANPATIVAVGPNGAVYSRDEAASWIAIDSANYWSVGFASPRAGWAVGARGRITRLSFGGVPDSLDREPALRSAQVRPTERAELLRVARRIVERARYAALITVDSAGSPQARTVEPLAPDSSFVILIGTNPRTRKVVEIRRNPAVAIYWFDPTVNGYVTLRGQASLVNDPAEKARRWKAGWEAFYPDRARDFLLIRVKPVRLEIVSPADGVTGDSITWRPPMVRWP